MTYYEHNPSFFMSVLEFCQFLSFMLIVWKLLRLFFKIHSCSFVATCSEDFDITLMICILRSLNFVNPPSSGWDKLPPVADNSLGAHLTRIKIYRNNFCHTSKARINDNTFRRIWSCLTHVSVTCFNYLQNVYTCLKRLDGQT